MAHRTRRRNNTKCASAFAMEPTPVAVLNSRNTDDLLTNSKVFKFSRHLFRSASLPMHAMQYVSGVSAACTMPWPFGLLSTRIFICLIANLSSKMNVRALCPWANGLVLGGKSDLDSIEIIRFANRKIPNENGKKT